LSAKKALLVALASLVTLAVLVLVIPFDAPGLGREVQDRVRSATGFPLEVSRSRIRLLHGLVLEEVGLVAGSYQVHVPRMVLEHRPLALLRGRRDLTGIELESGTIDFPGGSVSLEALRLTLSRLDYDPRALTPLHGLNSEGLLTMKRIAFESWELRDLAARVATEDGRFRLEGLKLATDHGLLSGEVALDFNSFPFRYRTSLLGASFEVEGVGRGTLRLDAEGFGRKARDLRGKGTFALERGRLPDAPWIREIDPALVGAQHAPVEIPFEVRDERVYFDRFELEVPERVLALEGSFGLDGSRDLRATVDRRPD
jgi:uncharacterized protein involved in outer membrane biogenesis